MAGRRELDPTGLRAGLDENGLGPQLGPLIVTAALARVDEAGAIQMKRKLPKSMRGDLDDSKVLVSSHDASLGEAWARALVERSTGRAAETPSELLRLLSLESEESQRSQCPKSTESQCWQTAHELFTSTDEQKNRIEKHLVTLEKKGIDLCGIRSEIVCTGRLNRLKAAGTHRFAADLHCMERLFLKFVEEHGAPICATCGKVGGIGKYEPFFGPLAGRLHMALEEGAARSCYYFPQLGEIRFVRDADAVDPLVMLASLVGKYLRELLMGRIARFYQMELNDPELRPSGYHDPVTAKFIKRTKKTRLRLSIVQDCFQRRPAN